MEPVELPLQWWAEGGYPEVARQLERHQKPGDRPVTPERCRRLVRGLLRRRFKATGDPVWKPFGHRGHEELRRRLRENRVLDHDLV